MELLTEIVAEKELTPYEIERNKPMPNLTHGAIQANLVFEIKLNFGDQHRIASEVSLATTPIGSTPDLVIYPQRSLNFINEPTKQTEPPLVTIGIQSPPQSNEEMVVKAYKYLEFGVKSSWIVYPAMKAVAVYSAPDQYDFFRDDELLKDETTGIEVDLSKVFE